MLFSIKKKAKGENALCLCIDRGAGDIATGIALRLAAARLQVVMTDLARPTAIRRTVCFSQAIVYGTAEVEGIRAVYAKDCAEAERIMAQGDIPRAGRP